MLGGRFHLDHLLGVVGVQVDRQRQPYRADLLPSGREVVDDAPRDDQVRARIVVRERQAKLVIVIRGGGASDRDDGRDRERQRAGAGRGDRDG